MKKWLCKNKKTIGYIAVFGLYTIFGGTLCFLAAALLIGWNLDPVALPVATVVFLLLMISLSVRLALPIKTWVKTLPVQYAISLITHLLLIEEWNFVLSTIASILLTSWLDLPANIWIGFGVSLIELTLIELLGIGIRALWRKLMEKYGSIPF